MLRTLLLVSALVLWPHPAPADGFESQRRVIEEIRGLKFVGPVETTAMTRQEFRLELEKRLGEGLAVPIDDYLQALEALHLIPGQEGVVENLLDLYEQQVLAFYDPLRHRYYSIADGPPGTVQSAALDDAVVIHELVHALQDQVFDAGRRFEALKTDADGQLAYQALLEGEATLVMLAYVYRSMGRTIEDLVSDNSALHMLAFGAASMDAGHSGAHPYFLQSLKFPYLEGFQLVLAAYRKGGWAEVNRIHRTRLPTTESVIHPDQFLSQRTETTPRFKIKRSSARCCRTLLATRLGEFHWRFLLGNAPSEGWADDFVTVVSNDSGNTTVLIETEWDRAQDAVEFADAYQQFLSKRSIPFSVRRQNRKVRVAYGAKDLAEAFAGPTRR